uniref:Uncharacterized protein n=1 Tax=Oryza glumipatula TaxID=40148 RepID=A0A0E0B7I3_9ORYZ
MELTARAAGGCGKPNGYLLWKQCDRIRQNRTDLGRLKRWMIIKMQDWVSRGSEWLLPLNAAAARAAGRPCPPNRHGKRPARMGRRTGVLFVMTDDAGKPEPVG